MKKTIKMNKKINWKYVGRVVLFTALVGLGIVGTLQFQKTIRDIKSEGVREYKLTCEKFTDKGAKVSWLECDA